MFFQKISDLVKKKSFRERVITGIILVAVLVLIFVLGYTIMLCVVGVLSLVGIWEFLRAEKILGKPFAYTAFIADIIYYVLIRFYAEENIALYMVFLFSLFAISDIIIYVLNYTKYTLYDLFASYFSVFYIGVTLSFLYLTRVHPWGAYLVWLAICASWGSDIFAYLTGMLFGKHKAFPVISPKKTYEGCIGGIIGAGFLGFIYALCVRGYILDMDHELILFPIICMVGSIVGIFGDLFASCIKRNAGIKDFSRLLPGHGGILDRFDSVILVSPVIYAITILLRL